jgi:penicillin-binding protein 2
MNQGSGDRKVRVLTVFVALLFAVLLLRLFHIQVLDDSYKRRAQNNIIRREVQIPPRGEVYDRNGEFLIQSVASYDLLAVPRDVRDLDTALLARITGSTVEAIGSALRKAAEFSSRRPSVIVKQMPLEAKLLFDENRFAGFFTTYRSQRHYPLGIAGNLLGYIGEVGPADIRRDEFYQGGDYMGRTGLERAYETELRGEKGRKLNVVDVRGVVKGPYMDGQMDIKPAAGLPLTTTIDAGLQAYGQELMRGKVGSIIAIEPSTGRVLMMVSSPDCDPNDLIGRDRSANFARLSSEGRKPLFNRALMSSYPPGSIFKMVNCLIALEEGVVRTSRRYDCAGEYTVGSLTMRCRSHPSPVNMRQAVQYSCNTYLANIFRTTLDNPRHGGVKNGYDVWREYVESFGFGNRLGIDLGGELPGTLFTRADYDRRYNRSWNSLTVLSLSIGQGELGCTPLQMANLCAIIANRGYYYTPHVVSRVGDRPEDEHFSERHYTKVAAEHFTSIVDGMYDVVHRHGETEGSLTYVRGLDICGKTGTVQNPHGEDHSTYIGFAPRNNPQIAVSVYVENGGFGGVVAAPIASLVIEYYLTGQISREWVESYVLNRRIGYPNYDRI